MTDDHRNRHRDGAHPDDVDPERLRYFTQPGDGRPSTRHRRRGSAAAPGTGGFAVTHSGVTNPSVTNPGIANPDVADARVAPTRPPAGPPVRRADTGSFRPPDTGAVRPAPASGPTPRPSAVSWDRETSRELDLTEPRHDELHHGEPHHDEVRFEDLRAEAHYSELGYAGRDHAGRDYYTGGRDHGDHDAGTAHLFGGSASATGPAAAQAVPGTERSGLNSAEQTRGARKRGVRGPARDASTRRRRRIVLAVVIACLLGLVGSVGYLGMRASGMFISHKDYQNAAGTSDVVVDLPENSTVADFGEILLRNDVVGSLSAFLQAAGNQSMSGGFYKLRTQLPAATAVEMITDPENTHRVGRVVIPEGLQLDSKEGVDGKVTPGIFQMIADNTAVTVNGRQEGVSVEQLEKAAADETPAALGVPEWATSAVADMGGDHRRIEGLIAPGAWEAINPTESATGILRDLISASAKRYEQWGLLNDNGSGLSPYESLVSASVVEREVTKPDDYPKVARVILNRLAKDQRLEMDSTANYTAAVTNIDVHGDAYKADNKWNTYRNKGLPITPIGAVGERSLEAVEHPANGPWLYFVTIDRNGTTLFANTFEEHQRNRDRACENKLLATGCS